MPDSPGVLTRRIDNANDIEVNHHIDESVTMTVMLYGDESSLLLFVSHERFRLKGKKTRNMRFLTQFTLHCSCFDLNEVEFPSPTGDNINLPFSNSEIPCMNSKTLATKIGRCNVFALLTQVTPYSLRHCLKNHKNTQTVFRINMREKALKNGLS